MDYKHILSVLLVLLVFCNGNAQRIGNWNDWTDRESLLENLSDAVKQGRTYFSTFKYYDYTQHGDIYSSRMPADLGHPYMYSFDFFQAMGNYMPEGTVKTQRKNIAAIIKAAWKKNHSIPVVSWHLHNPYAVYEDFQKGMGARYHHLVKGYPKNHRYAINEILNHVQVDTLGIGNMADWFDDQVREVATFINTEMTDKNGRPIPFIFRLWHEQQDSWAWWCYSAGNHDRSHVSVADYKAFWRLTVEKFREYCPDAQILWCYGPDRYFSTEAMYMKSYPGDDVVDLFAYDDYRIGAVSRFTDVQQMLDESIKRARIVTKVAEDHGKIAFIAESNCMEKDYKDEYFDWVQDILKDPEVHMAIFQMWSMSYYKEQTIKFIDSKNIIFDR